MRTDATRHGVSLSPLLACCFRWVLDKRSVLMGSQCVQTCSTAIGVCEIYGVLAVSNISHRTQVLPVDVFFRRPSHHLHGPDSVHHDLGLGRSRDAIERERDRECSFATSMCV